MPEYEHSDWHGEVLTRCTKHDEAFLGARGEFCVGCEVDSDDTE